MLFRSALPERVEAAGVLLVREAGGFVSDLDGGDAVLTKGHVAAGNETMHRELLRLLRQAGKDAAQEALKDASKDASGDSAASDGNRTHRQSGA